MRLLLLLALLAQPIGDPVFDGLVETLKAEEGFRSRAYQDSQGILTIGYGTNLEAGLTKAEAVELLRGRLRRFEDELRAAWKPFNSQPRGVQVALLDMALPVGVAGLLRFHTTLSRLESGDYSGAADSALKSLWARQTPARATRAAKAFRAAGL